jgi:hypothetical protein
MKLSKVEINNECDLIPWIVLKSKVESMFPELAARELLVVRQS